MLASSTPYSATLNVGWCMADIIAAPLATLSEALTVVNTFLTLKVSQIIFWTAGILKAPPTHSTEWI